MKKRCIFGLLLLASACTPSSQDADFKSFIKSFHQSKWKQFPILAAQAGYKEFDKILPIPNKNKLNSDLNFCKKYHDSLQIFDTSRLSVPFQFEYNKIKPFLVNHIHNFEIQKIHETDPTYYNLYDAFASILKMKSTSIELRLEILESKLKKVPEFYAAAKENLKTPDQQKLQEAINQQIQLYFFFDQQVPDSFQDKGLTENQLIELNRLTFQAKLSTKDFIAFCKSAAFEYFDEALNVTPPSSSKNQLEKVFTAGK